MHSRCKSQLNLDHRRDEPGAYPFIRQHNINTNKPSSDALRAAAFLRPCVSVKTRPHFLKHKRTLHLAHRARRVDQVHLRDLVRRLALFVHLTRTTQRRRVHHRVPTLRRDLHRGAVHDSELVQHLHGGRGHKPSSHGARPPTPAVPRPPLGSCGPAAYP